MTVWFDDLARRLGSVEEGRLGRVSRRTTLSKMLGAVITASPLVAPNLLSQSARAGGKCKKNKDCRRNQRCRHGRCERDGNGGGGGGGGNDKWERAGKNSRGEGVDEWRVDRRGSGYEVEFRHSNKNLSGTVNITFGGNGKTIDFSLKSDKNRLTLALNLKDGIFAGTDGSGRAMSARWNGNRQEWTMTAQSNSRINDNMKAYRIGMAIASDLWARDFGPRYSRRTSQVNGSATSVSQGACSKEERMYAESGALDQILDAGTDRFTECEGLTELVTDYCEDTDHCGKGCCDLGTCACWCIFR